MTRNSEHFEPAGAAPSRSAPPPCVHREQRLLARTAEASFRLLRRPMKASSNRKPAGNGPPIPPESAFIVSLRLVQLSSPPSKPH